MCVCECVCVCLAVWRHYSLVALIFPCTHCKGKRRQLEGSFHGCHTFLAWWDAPPAQDCPEFAVRVQSVHRCHQHYEWGGPAPAPAAAHLARMDTDGGASATTSAREAIRPSKLISLDRYELMANHLFEGLLMDAILINIDLSLITLLFRDKLRDLLELQLSRQRPNALFFSSCY